MPKLVHYPPQVVAARGRKIELIDGTTATLLYSFASIMRIEEEHDSIATALTAVGENMKFGTLVKLMCAGLLHETHESGLLSDPEVLAPQLDTLLMGDYSDAIGEAFEASFPKTPDPTVGESLPEMDPSPGPSGGMPQPSSSAAPTPSSGL